jgi:serine/threonine protein kinase
MIGQQVGNYRITAKLGEGPTGEVFLAEHPVIGKKVVVKLVREALSSDADLYSRFVTRAKAVNQIGHEHIVDLADFFTTRDGQSGYVMEYLGGESLFSHLRQEGKLEPRRALAMAAQVADALSAAHDYGIPHGNLKSENIFLVRGRGGDFVKVLDFGVFVLDPDGFIERVWYLSPEECARKQSADHLSDIYSLGVLLFEMLTGMVPFGGEGLGEILIKQVTMSPPSVRSIVRELPSVLDPILFRALAKDRDRRFQSMAELQAALLDPAGYVRQAPVTEIPDDLPGVARAAHPMTRAEIDRSAGPREVRKIRRPKPPPRSAPRSVLARLAGVFSRGSDDRDDQRRPVRRDIPFENTVSPERDPGRYVFVSYSHQDKKHVYPEIDHIQNGGMPVWYDEGIAAGSEWKATIVRAIKGSAGFLIFLSGRAFASDNVVKELSLAIEMGKTVVPVYLENAAAPDRFVYDLALTQAIYRFKMEQDHFRRQLDSALARLLSVRSQRD